MELRCVSLTRDYSEISTKSLLYGEDDIDWSFYRMSEHATVLLCRPEVQRGEKKELVIVDFSTEDVEPVVSSLGIVIEFEHTILIAGPRLIVINHDNNSA